MESAELMEIEGEVIILNPETHSVTKLNESGGQLWQLLSESRTVEELTDHLASSYDGVPRDQIQEDVRKFIQNMQEIGLVRVE
jgi:hypothetical protein